MSARWLFSRMKTSRSNNRTAQSAEATRTALIRVRFRPLLRGRLRRCGDVGWTMVGVPPGSALETAIGLTNLTALTRTAPASEQQGCDPSVTVSS